METQEEKGRLMEKDGGAKGAAGSGQTAGAASPQPGTRGPCQWGIPAAKARPPTPAAAARCGGPARRDASRAHSPESNSPGLAVVPTPPPSPGGADSNPPPRPFLLAQMPCGLTAGRTRVGRGRAPCLSHTHRQRMLERGRHCLLRRSRSQSARPGSLPAFLPRALRPQALPRPAPRPHSRSQVASRPHLPACQNGSPPEPDPSHSRHTTSSLRFRNAGGRIQGD